MSYTWKPIPGFDGKYQVSDDGEIAVKRPSGDFAVLAKSVDERGYYRAWVNGKKVRVHKLIALAFLGPRPDKMEVCHIDGIKTNNSTGNLKYGTHKENMQDRCKHGKTALGRQNGKSKLAESTVIEIAKLLTQTNLRQSQIAKTCGVSKDNVRAISRGVVWSWLTGIPKNTYRPMPIQVRGRPPHAKKQRRVV